jgi:hypothetical protein
MSTAYVAVGTLTAAANGTFAILDFLRSEFVLQNMARVRVTPSWLYPLGFLKLAGAVGLLIGIAVPALGVAAALGLVLFFIGAIAAHIRAHDYSSIPFPGTLLLAAIASLVLRVASS